MASVSFIHSIPHDILKGYIQFILDFKFYTNQKIGDFVGVSTISIPGFALMDFPYLISITKPRDIQTKYLLNIKRRYYIPENFSLNNIIQSLIAYKLKLTRAEEGFTSFIVDMDQIVDILKFGKLGF